MSSRSSSSARRRQEAALDIILNEAIVNGKPSAIQAISGMNRVSQAARSRFTALQEEKPSALPKIGRDLSRNVLRKLKEVIAWMQSVKNPDRLPSRFGLPKRFLRYKYVGDMTQSSASASSSSRTASYSSISTDSDDLAIGNHDVSYRLPENMAIDWQKQFKLSENLFVAVTSDLGSARQISVIYRIDDETFIEMIVPQRKTIECSIELNSGNWSNTDVQNILAAINNIGVTLQKKRFKLRFLVEKDFPRLKKQIKREEAKYVESGVWSSTWDKDFTTGYVIGPSEDDIPFENADATSSARSSARS